MSHATPEQVALLHSRGIYPDSRSSMLNAATAAFKLFAANETTLPQIWRAPGPKSGSTTYHIMIGDTVYGTGITSADQSFPNYTKADLIAKGEDITRPLIYGLFFELMERPVPTPDYSIAIIAQHLLRAYERETLFQCVIKGISILEHVGQVKSLALPLSEVWFDFIENMPELDD